MATSNPSELDQRQRLREAAVAAADALVDAATAQTAADAAASVAGGMVIRSTATPSGTGVADGALWMQVVSGSLVGMWQWDASGSTWGSPQEVDPQIIASAIIGALAAGTIDTTSVTIKSGDAGARQTLDGNLHRFYNSSGVLTAEIGGADGHVNATNATITGTFRNAPVGSERIEIQPYASGAGVMTYVSASGVTGGRILLDFLNAELSLSNSSVGQVSIIGNRGSGTGAVSIFGKSGSSGGVVSLGANDTINLNGAPLTASAGSSTINAARIGDLPSGVTVNGDLVLPSGVTDYDTGWVSCSLGSGYSGSAQVRRIGRQGFIRGDVTTPSLPANSTSFAVTVPTGGYRPGTSGAIPGAFTNGETAWTIIDASTGVISVRKPTAGIATLRLGGSWLVD